MCRPIRAAKRASSSVLMARAGTREARGSLNSGANQQWASTANGAALDQSTCTAGANQQWMVV